MPCSTVHNNHLLQFMSPILEPLALVVDALSQDWQGRSVYIFLPFPLLNKVIQRLCATQEAEVILIAPCWPSQLWFPHLLRLCFSLCFFLCFSHTAEIYCHNRDRDSPWTESRTICTHGGSHATLQSSRISRGL